MRTFRTDRQAQQRNPRSCDKTLFRAALALVLSAAASLGGFTGCGGGGGTPSAAASQTPVLQMTLTPGTASLAVGTQVTLTVSGVSGTSVAWSVDGVLSGNATVGTVAGTGTTATYTAPSAAGSHVVTATSSADPDTAASTSIQVVETAGVSVALSPTSASVNTGASTTLTASVTGSSDTAVAWTVDGIANGSASVGTLAVSGTSATYTAPASAGSHVVTATSSADPDTAASTSIQVVETAGVSVALSPASASVNTGASTTLTASVTGSSNTAVAWTVDGISGGNSSVGTLAVSGTSATYTAPASAGSHVVMATSAADSSSSASAAITVQAAASSAVVTLNHAGSSTVNASGSMLFNATVSGVSNTAVTWAVDGIPGGNATVGVMLAGSGNNYALYKAPAAAGSHTVSAISAADAARSAAQAVTVASTAYTVINPSKVYNVKTLYGAAGNGSSDDTAAIQNAINAATGAGGGVVQVPSGTYMINHTYFGSYGLRMKSNVTLQLDAGATLKSMSNAPTASYMIVFSGGSNMNIVGSGVLDGNKGAIGLHEATENICFWGGSNIVLAGFTTQNAPGDGIYINGYPDAASVGTPVSDVLIYGVTSTSNGRNGISPDGCEGLIIRDSTFSNQTSGSPMNGIDIEPLDEQKPNNYQIFNCVLSGNSGGAIASGTLEVANTATFTNMTYAFNQVSNCGSFGIEAQNGAGPVAIVNNTVSATYKSSVYGGYGILTTGHKGLDRVTVAGNTVSGSASDGILLAFLTNSTCTGNTVTGSGGKGINNLSGTGLTLGSNTLSGNTGGN